jgi:hypothetical protein
VQPSQPSRSGEQGKIGGKGKIELGGHCGDGVSCLALTRFWGDLVDELVNGLRGIKLE